MTTTAPVEQGTSTVQSSTATQQNGSDKKGKAMVNIPTIPDTPVKLKNSDNPLAQAMVPVFDATVNQAREAVKVIKTYRETHEKETELLNTSEAEEVVAFRKERDKYNRRVAEYKKQYEDNIKEFVELFESQKTDANKALSEAESNARKSINLESGVSAEDNVAALERYKAAAETIKLMVAGVKKQGVDVGNYGFPVISSGGKSSAAEKRFVPRFDKVLINGKEFTPPKMNDLATAVGAQRDFISDQLIRAVGGDRAGWDDLASGSDVHFAISKNDVRYDIVVTKAEPPVRAKKDKVTGQLVEVTDEDDEDEDEEDDE